MSVLKKVCLAALILGGLGACTTTSSQVKSTGGPKGTKVSYSSEKATPLDEYYEQAAQNHKMDKSVPVIYGGSVPEGKQLFVQMEPEFGRTFLVCEDEKDCAAVRPVPSETDNNNSTSNTDPDGAVDESVIAEVRLSEKTKALYGHKLPELKSGKGILIMEPDIELSLLTAGGVKEPHALWTSAAKKYFTELSTQYFQKLGHSVTLYKQDANEVDAKTGQDLINLHDGVGKAIFLHQYAGVFQLPTTKDGRFDWGLGKTTQKLSEAYGADLGLFVYMEDSYSSGSRVAAQVLMAALFGVHVPGGQQVGFVSLVDLKTGEIVWYNRLFSTTGDLRTFGAARKATNALLSDIPL